MITTGLLNGLNLVIIDKTDDQNHYFHQEYSNLQSQLQSKLYSFLCCFILIDYVY